MLWVFPVLFLIVIRWGVGFEGVYGQDSYAYVDYAQRLKAAVISGGEPGGFYWPVNFPLYGAVFHLILPVSLALQLVSFIAFLLVLDTLVKYFKTREKQKVIVYSYVAVAVLFSPYFLRASILCMSDMLAALFVLLSYTSYKRYVHSDKQQWILLMAFAVCSAVMTRYVAAIVVLPIVLAVFYYIIRKRVVAPFYWITAMLICISVVTPHFLLQSGDVFEFLEHKSLSQWSLSNVFRNSFVGEQGTVSYWVPNLAYVLSPFGHAGYLMIGALLLGIQTLIRRKWFHSKVLVLSIALYSLFIAGLPLQNQRFFILIFPLVVLLLFPSYRWLFDRFKQGKVVLVVILAIILQSGLFVYSFKKFSARSFQEKNVANYLKTYYSDQIIYSFDIDISLPYHGVSNEIRNLYSNTFSAFRKGSVVLIHPDHISEQWKGTNPYLNWQLMNQYYDVVEVKQFEGGWTLYEIR